MKREFVVGPYESVLVVEIGGARFYKMAIKRARAFAQSINEELAEGPTRLLRQKYGIVELWPLVYSGGDDAVSG